MTYWGAVLDQIRDLFWGFLVSAVLYGGGAYYFLHKAHDWRTIAIAVSLYGASFFFLLLLVAWQAYSIAQKPIQEVLNVIRKENKRAEAKMLQDLMERYKSGGSSPPPP